MVSTIAIATLFYLTKPCDFMVLQQKISETMLDKEGSGEVIIEIQATEKATEQTENNTTPDNIRVIITSADDVTSIRLTRLKHKTQKTPILITMTTDGLKTEIINERKIKKTFYRNEDTKSAFTFTYDNSGIKEVFGHFIQGRHLRSILPVHHHGNQNLEYRHPKLQKRFTTPIRKHKISNIELPIDYEIDEMEFKETMSRYYQTVKRTKREDKARKIFVEYLIVADYENYKLWYRDTENTALTDEQKDGLTKYRMMEFYQHVIHGIDTIFSSLNNRTLQLEVVLAGVVFTNVSGFATWTENKRTCTGCTTVDDQEVLSDFARWRKDILSKVVRHDHAALYTGFDLYYTAMESSKTVGLSYLGQMCMNGSVSIVEEKRNALTIHIAAHELGHNFGAYHDGGTKTRACSSDDRYLMASSMSGTENSTGGSNPWTFSPCSKRDVLNYITDLDREDDCLLNVPLNPNLVPSIQPGILYTADQQCQGQFGNESVVCREYHMSDWSGLCYSLACKNEESDDCILIFPHEGTPCGHKMWCQQGKCRYHEDALAVNDFCPIGDDPSLNCSYICEHYADYKDYYNYEELRRGLCCNTCFNGSLYTTQAPSTRNATFTYAETSTSVTDTYYTDNIETSFPKTKKTESIFSRENITTGTSRKVTTNSKTLFTSTTSPLTSNGKGEAIYSSTTTLEPTTVVSIDKASHTIEHVHTDSSQTLHPTGDTTLSEVTSSKDQAIKQNQSTTVTKETDFSQYANTKINIFTTEFTQTTEAGTPDNQSSYISSTKHTLTYSTSLHENNVFSKADSSSLHYLLFYLLAISGLS